MFVQDASMVTFYRIRYVYNAQAIVSYVPWMDSVHNVSLDLPWPVKNPVKNAQATADHAYQHP